MVLMNLSSGQQWRDAEIREQTCQHTGEEEGGAMERLAWIRIQYHM